MKATFWSRVLAAGRQVARWYIPPTGFLFGAAVLAGVFVAFTIHRGAGAGLVAFALLVVLPYKLTRVEQARQRAGLDARQLKTQMANVQSRLGGIVAVDRRTQQLRRDLLGSVATARDELTLLLRSERLIWTDALASGTADSRRELADTRRELADLVERLDRTEATAATELGDIADRLATLDRATADVSGRLSNDRRQRHLAGARRDAARRPVEGVLLLICAQRVGSTWLVDLLRHHPLVDIYPTADVYRQLGVSGRRYPAHLSEACRDGVEVEVQDGVGGLVPAVAGPAQAIGDDRPGFAIEKVHPSAIGFDPDRFVRRVETLRATLGGDRVIPLYLVREPVESMQSFVAYRRRDSAWHDDVPERHVHDFYRRSYEVIDAIYSRLPGPVITYELLRQDPVTAFANLLATLELEKTELESRRTAEGAVAAASLATRPGRNPFFSSDVDKPPATAVELGVDTDDPGRAQESLERCRTVIASLTSPGPDARWPVAPT